MPSRSLARVTPGYVPWRNADGTGSTTVHPHNNESLTPVELGASIFVEANTHLVKAAKVSPSFRQLLARRRRTRAS
jgi:hypothetical protein